MDHQPPPHYGSSPYNYVPQPPQYQPPRPKRRRANKIILGVVGGIFALFAFFVVVGVAVGGGRSQTPADAPLGSASPDKTRKAAGATKPKAKPKPKIVSFVVTGRAPSGVDVQYGNDTDTRQGPSRLPMRKTLKLHNDALYYDVIAQLQGSGDITCKVLINGKTVASGHASGGYNICHAQKNAGLLGF